MCVCVCVMSPPSQKGRGCRGSKRCVCVCVRVCVCVVSPPSQKGRGCRGSKRERAASCLETTPWLPPRMPAYQSK
jgi:hypothetical protein